MHTNIVKHNEQHFVQIVGTAMGTPIAVLFANIFLYMIERTLINQLINDGLTLFYARYIDDTFVVLNNPGAFARFQAQCNRLIGG